MLTAIYKKVRFGYIAWVEEIPGVNTEGRTKAEARANLGDALREFVAARRKLTKREIGEKARTSDVLGPSVLERYFLKFSNVETHNDL